MRMSAEARIAHVGGVMGNETNSRHAPEPANGNTLALLAFVDGRDGVEMRLNYPSQVTGTMNALGLARSF